MITKSDYLINLQKQFSLILSPDLNNIMIYGNIKIHPQFPVILRMYTILDVIECTQIKIYLECTEIHMV